MPCRIAQMALLALSLAGCADLSGPLIEVEPQVTRGSLPPLPEVAGWSAHIDTGAISGPDRAIAGYRLDSGDRVRVFVYGQPNLSRIYPVDQNGTIAVPLIGAVTARGRTASQLEHAIRAALGARFVRDPQVTVDMAENRPFFILGEVRNAGQYPYVSGLTIKAAVAIAGGFSERADEEVVQVTSRDSGRVERNDFTTDHTVQPGDTIYVYERLF